MKLFCTKFSAFATLSAFPARGVFYGEKPNDAAKEKPAAGSETASESDLQQAKRDYSERWDTLKKFRDQDPSVRGEIKQEDFQKLSARAGVVANEFLKKVQTDKKLVDPEKIYTSDVVDSERVKSTLGVLDGIIEKYGSEKKGNAPEWLREAVAKQPRKEFNEASSVMFGRLQQLIHPILGGDANQKNPETNDYLRDPGVLARLEMLQTRIGSLGNVVATSTNLDFIQAATMEVKGMEAEIQKLLVVDTGRGHVGWALEEAFYGSPSGKGFLYLPKASQKDTVLLERIASRLKFAKHFDFTRVPEGTSWTLDKAGFNITITKGPGREFKTTINNVYLHIVEKYGASFVKYLAPEDRKYVKSYNESTGEVVVERTWPVPENDVPPAVVSQYKTLDPQFDKDPAPKRVTVGGDTFVVSRTVEAGKKRYRVEKVVLA